MASAQIDQIGDIPKDRSVSWFVNRIIPKDIFGHLTELSLHLVLVRAMGYLHVVLGTRVGVFGKSQAS